MTAPNEERLCKDCAFFVPSPAFTGWKWFFLKIFMKPKGRAELKAYAIEYALCNAPAVVEILPGVIDPYPYADVARMADTPCGPDAKLFAKREGA